MYYTVLQYTIELVTTFNPFSNSIQIAMGLETELLIPRAFVCPSKGMKRMNLAVRAFLMAARDGNVGFEWVVIRSG